VHKFVRLVLATVPFLGILAGSLVVTSPASASGGFPPIPPGPILFGLTTPETGAYAAYGATTKESFDAISLTQFNSTHPNGIDGHKVQVDLLDDQSTITGAVNTANELVADHVAGIITVTYDEPADPAQVAVYVKNKVPIVAQMFSEDATNVKKYPYYFTQTATQGQEAVAAAKWIAARGYTSIVALNDGVGAGVDQLNLILSAMKKYAPKAKVLANVAIPPGSVDDTAAVAKLKSYNPQLVLVFSTAAYGSLWNAMHAINWAPTILASAGAWYDGFSAMGDLVANAYSPYEDCASSASETFSPTLESLFAQYNAATYGYSTNYLTYVNSDTAPFYILAYAIEKYHSTAPAAIKKALEGAHHLNVLGLNYSFSATNHAGLTGPFGAAVCDMGPPYAGGKGVIPVIASK
jgi:ABC-type branched-subunit amino acid transport system substrate-binding protein